MPFETVSLKTVEYLSVPSVVGHEGHFFKYLKNDFEKLGLTAIQHDGILEISGAKPQSQIISAHIDRHGLISIGGGKYAYAAQYVKEEKYDEQNVPSQKNLNAISDRFEDEIVYAYDPETGDKLGEGVIKDCDPCIANGDAVFFVEGMRDMEENIPIAYARLSESDGMHLKGQIDNVVSLGIIYVLFQNGFQGTALLSAEEEIGKSWIHIQNWLQTKQVETKDLIILDTSPYRETTPVDNDMVVLRNQDKSAAFNTALTQKIAERCREIGINYQIKDEYFLSLGLEQKDLGSTELGRLVLGGEGRWSGTTVQIPTTEYHTSYETTSKGCIESFYRLLNSILIGNKII